MTVEASEAHAAFMVPLAPLFAGTFPPAILNVTVDGPGARVEADGALLSEFPSLLHMTIKPAETDDEIGRCFPALAQLQPHLERTWGREPDAGVRLRFCSRWSR